MFWQVLNYCSFVDLCSFVMFMSFINVVLLRQVLFYKTFFSIICGMWGSNSAVVRPSDCFAEGLGFKSHGAQSGKAILVSIIHIYNLSFLLTGKKRR